MEFMINKLREVPVSVPLYLVVNRYAEDNQLTVDEMIQLPREVYWVPMMKIPKPPDVVVEANNM